MKVYEGDPVTKEVIVREDGGPARPLRHYIRHSPDGFAWGYGGSGPAELARCILIDHYGLSSEQAKDEWENHLPVSYQDFKFQVVALVSKDSKLVITSEEIEEWLATRAKPMDEHTRGGYPPLKSA